MNFSDLLLALCKPDILSGVIECAVRLLLSADFRKYCLIVATFVWLQSGNILDLQQRLLCGPSESKSLVRNQPVNLKESRRKKRLRVTGLTPIRKTSKRSRIVAKKQTTKKQLRIRRKI